MFEQFYALSFNPFSKAVPVKHAVRSDNLTQVGTRLDHLLRTGGIGLVCADSGSGKTLAIRAWSDGLNRNTHKVVYVCMSTLSTSEFYRQLCYELGVEPSVRKVDMFREIQARIRQLSDEKRMKVVVIIDEAQFLSKAILEDLVMITNFDMDSRDYFSLVLVGLPHLSTTLARRSHEALRQRVCVNYSFAPLTPEQAEAYLSEMLRSAGGDPDLFTHEAAMAAYASCGGSMRRLGAIATGALMIGAQAGERTITEEMVLAASDEVTLG